MRELMFRCRCGKKCLINVMLVRWLLIVLLFQVMFTTDGHLNIYIYIYIGKRGQVRVELKHKWKRTNISSTAYSFSNTQSKSEWKWITLKCPTRPISCYLLIGMDDLQDECHRGHHHIWTMKVDVLINIIKWYNLTWVFPSFFRFK